MQIQSQYVTALAVGIRCIFQELCVSTEWILPKATVPVHEMTSIMTIKTEK